MTVGGLVPGTVWSFDRANAEGARARRDSSDPPLIVGQSIDRPPDAVLELVDLHAFVKDPVAVFTLPVRCRSASRMYPRPTTRCFRSSREISTRPTWVVVCSSAADGG